MNKFVLRQSVLLLLTASVWGVAFVAQSVGMDYVGPFTFNAVRNLLGAAVLLPVILRPNRRKASPAGNEQQEPEAEKKMLFFGGVSCGALLFIGSSLQQIGIRYTTAGKAGFITAMYIVMVPLLGIFLRKKVGLRVLSAVIIAAAGLYMLCMTEGRFVLRAGDLLELACAFAFSVHILVIDYFSQKADGVKMSCIQFFTCALLSTALMVLFEQPKMEQIFAAWLPILYAGVMSCGVGYTLQIVGQRGMNPTVASLILSLESVVSVIAGWALLGEQLSVRELAGCILMFGAIVLVQLPGRKGKKELPGVQQKDTA